MKFNGKKIKLKRIELDLSQKDLADLCKIGIGTISGIEKHSKMPNLKILIRIKESLNVSFDYFFEV